MAPLIFDYAKGRWVEKYKLPIGGDNILVVLVKAAGLQADSTLNNYQFLSELLAGGNAEADFTNYCVGMDTECLTRRAGWTRHDQLEPADEILAFDQETNATRWERPLEVFVNPEYSGPMVTLSARGFSARTTPDHRWPVVQMSGTWPNKAPKLHTLTTGTLPNQRDWNLLRHAPFGGPSEPTYSDEFVRIVAWYFTEGSLRRDGKSITISQSHSHNPEHVESIRRDIKALGATPPVRPASCSRAGCDGKVNSNGMCLNHYQSDQRARKRRGETFTPGRHRAEGLRVTERIRASDQLVTWDLFGTGVDSIIACCPGKQKVPTMAFLSALTAEQAKMFVEVCVAADGTPEANRFEQHDDARMSAFTVAAVLAGHGPTLGADGTSCHLHSHSPYVRLKNVRRAREDFTGLIWCPVLPSGFWVARRDGKVHITGNTRKVLSAADITVSTNTGTGVTTVDTSDQVWNAAGGAVNNTLGALLTCYRPTSSTPDSGILLLTKHDYTIGTTGGNLTAQVPSIGTVT